MWNRCIVVACLLPSPCVAAAETGSADEVRLVLQITVDQLRGDLPGRVLDRLEPGGFRYLWEQGTVYVDAHHAHANTETIVGHATLATGAHPATHGMVANVWLDRETGRLTYNIEDPRYELLTGGAGVDKQTEIDPTQKAAGTQGRSPSALLVSTFSDELAIHTAGRARIFAVSVKDRGAVSMAGHAGKAFWFSKQSGEFVTSNYYYEQYPDWVREWNRRKLPFSYAGKSWELMHDQSSYLFGDRDDQEWETDFPGYGRTFPHPFGTAGSKYFTTLLTISPVGDALTLGFAKTLLENEELGKDEVPDYLAVSFSSTDYVGHLFGPSSLESEDNLLRLDRTLADLLAFVDEKVGLEHTLVVLSADHGAPEAPGYLNEMGISARYVNPGDLDKGPALAALEKQFGVGQELIRTYYHPYLYLNRDVIRERGLDLDAVVRSVARELEAMPGIAFAVPSRDLAQGRVPDTALYKAVLRNFHARRSGDIYVVFEPHSFANDFDGLIVASSHGTPWSYDTFVPIVFAGANVPARHVQRRVYTVDVAPTLAAFLQIKPPSGAAGVVLVEVFGSQTR